MKESTCRTLACTHDRGGGGMSHASEKRKSGQTMKCRRLDVSSHSARDFPSTPFCERNSAGCQLGRPISS